MRFDQIRYLNSAAIILAECSKKQALHNKFNLLSIVIILFVVYIIFVENILPPIFTPGHEEEIKDRTEIQRGFQTNKESKQ